MKPETRDERVRRYMEKRNKKKIYELDLDGPLFRQQRQILLHLIYSDRVGKGKEIELLEGLISMLDDIADQAHDNYEIDCLLTEKENVD